MAKAEPRVFAATVIGLPDPGPKFWCMPMQPDTVNFAEAATAGEKRPRNGPPGLCSPSRHRGRVDAPTPDRPLALPRTKHRDQCDRAKSVQIMTQHTPLP